MRESVQVLGRTLPVQMPGVLDRSAISIVLRTADVDWARAQLGLLGLCLTKGPKRLPGEALAQYGERIWEWLQHLGATDEQLGEILDLCYELQSEVLGLTASVADATVTQAKDFSEADPTSSAGSGSPTSTPGTPSDG